MRRELEEEGVVASVSEMSPVGVAVAVVGSRLEDLEGAVVGGKGHSRQRAGLVAVTVEVEVLALSVGVGVGHWERRPSYRSCQPSASRSSSPWLARRS